MKFLSTSKFQKLKYVADQAFSDLQHRWKTFKEELLISAILDPRYKDLSFLDEEILFSKESVYQVLEKKLDSILEKKDEKILPNEEEKVEIVTNQMEILSNSLNNNIFLNPLLKKKEEGKKVTS